MARKPTREERIDDLIRRAEEHHEAERYAEAYELYCEVLELDPENGRVFAKRGTALTRLDRSAEAIRDFSKAIRIDPSKALYFRSRGTAYRNVEDISAAIRDFGKAIRLDPEDPRNYALRGETASDDDPDAADADFRKAIGLGCDEADPFIFVAQRAVDEEDWETAEEFGRAGLVHCPEDGYLNHYFGRALYGQDRFAESLEPLAFAAEALPDDGVMLYYHACCLWELSRHAEAIPVYDEAIRLDPDDSWAWYQRGYCHWMEDDFDRALADLTESLRLERGVSTVLGLRGKVLTDLGQPDAALKDLDRAIRSDPEEIDHRLARADALHAAKRSEIALEELGDRIAENAEEPLYHWHRAVILKEMEEYDDALDSYERNRDLGGDELNGAIEMGLCYTLLHDNENTLATFQRVVELDPEDSAHKFFCAFALSRMGDSEEARRYFAEAIALDPNSWTAHYHRGASWEADGEFELALADYDRAIEIAPGETKVRVARLNLHESLGDHARALADCDALIEIEPENAEHRWRRSGLWDALGDSARADTDAIDADKLERRAENAESEGDAMTEEKLKIWAELQAHFGAVPLAELTLTERHFPVQVGADLQKALDTLDAAGLKILHFWVARMCGQPVTHFPGAYVKDRRNPPLASSPQYQEIDIGEDEPVRALRDGLWLLKSGKTALALILDTTSNYRSIRFQVAALASSGSAATKIFQHLEETVRQSPCYRGKILSLEAREMYSGQNQGLRVHRLRTVPREDVILPQATLDLLDRNVAGFVRQRKHLIEMGLTGKKGLLFYGPPGTGKTHTIHYLAQSTPEQTTFLITAQQVGVLDEYMTLARLYQPSLVVIEDVDLIARHREEMRSSGEEALLNKLLNEMDGLQIDAKVLFILTTNRPEALEAALASRPGRIDQAIEFPVPNAEGRAKLAKLYSGKFILSDKVAERVVSRTAGQTASFLKELMRRAAQIALERGERKQLGEPDLDTAFDELLLLGSTLNRKLLGFAEPALRT